jgi:hypothetical protein
MQIHASNVHNAHRLAIKASERVPCLQWEAYKSIRCLDDRLEKNVGPKIVRETPQAEHVSDESEVAEKKPYEVRVEVCRWCDIVIEAPSKRAAVRRAASMDVATIAPPSAWDGCTSARSEEDNLEPRDWETE